MYQFNAEKTKNDCVAWIRDFFEKNGPGCNAVVGISGGKDSSIVAALCAEAGANVLVAGSAVFGKADRAAAIRAIRENTRKN